MEFEKARDGRWTLKRYAPTQIEQRAMLAAHLHIHARLEATRTIAGTGPAFYGIWRLFEENDRNANKIPFLFLGRVLEYQVIGRHLPSAANPTPKLFRMRIFAPNKIVAKSRFWYFLAKLKKIKKANGEIVSLNIINEKRPSKVKNFGIWIRYDSRSGTHNMYKEYREMSRTDAVDALYQDMAARHRARFRSIHILKVVEIEKKEDVKRPYIQQLIKPGLKFPLPHRVPRKSARKIFAPHRPATYA